MLIRLLASVVFAASGLLVSPSPAMASSAVVVVANDIHAGSGTDALRMATSNLAIKDAPALTLLAGDIASAGLTAQYEGGYARTWGRLPHVVPAPGNHDYRVPGAAQYKAYFKVTTTYSAHDLGRWRIYSLDSQIAMNAASPQYAFLKADLAAHPGRPIMAVWHQPRYASFHTDTATTQPLLDLLAAARADLVVNGHDHIYQRMAVEKGIRQLTDGPSGWKPRAIGVLDKHVVKAVSASGYLRIVLADTSYTASVVDTKGVVRDTVTAPVHN